jgi:hypothetical protein
MDSFGKIQVRKEDELTEAIATATGAKRILYVSLKYLCIRMTPAKKSWNGDRELLLQTAALQILNNRLAVEEFFLRI